jgi:hypothetical protein
MTFPPPNELLLRRMNEMRRENDQGEGRQVDAMQNLTSQMTSDCKESDIRMNYANRGSDNEQRFEDTSSEPLERRCRTQREEQWKWTWRSSRQ